MRRVTTAFLLVALLGAASCAGNDDATSATGAAATTTSARTRPAGTTTTDAPHYQARVVDEVVVDPAYRQGVARAEHGWVFSINDGLFATDDALRQTSKRTPAIPQEWAARGFNHVGDIDIVDGVLYAALEQSDYDRGRQAMLVYDAATLAYRNGVEVDQHHASFVTVDEATGIAYSTDEFGDDTLLRYDVSDGWRALAPLRMSAFVDRIQGGDVRDGAIWLSTDDTTDGVYRVDVRTGAVQPLGSIGHADGEGEGIDATPVGGAQLHVLSVDAKLVPVRLISLAVDAAGS